MPKLFRCSSLADLIGNPKGKGEVITETAKSAIRKIVKEDLYGFKSFTGNQYTQKGIMLEDQAIELSDVFGQDNIKNMLVVLRII